MKKILFVTLIISMTVAAALCGCSRQTFELFESPQVYVLENKDEQYMQMPTVTLYSNQNASLSQPAISSFGMFDIGRYTLSGNKLTVSHAEGISVTFIVSDGGKTLTVKEASGSYAKIGAVYKYLPDGWIYKGSWFIDPNNYKTIEGEALTLDVLRELAEKGGVLAFSDFDRYTYIELDLDCRVFNVDSEYTVRLVKSSDGELSCIVERNSSGECFPLHRSGSTGLVFDEFLGIKVVPKYNPRQWIDYFFDDTMPWERSESLTLPEFPGVKFTWTPMGVSANDKELFSGMPVRNVFLADLTNDGKPELCATVSFGSGIIDERIIVYDYEEDKMYELVDRGTYNYRLSLDDGTLNFKGKLVVTRTDYNDSFNGVSGVTAELRLENGKICKP